MYLHITPTKNGKFLTAVQKYRDPATGKVKEKTIKTFGYAEKYADQFEDPIAHFREVVAQMTKDQKVEMTSTTIINLRQKLDPEHDSAKNVGYFPFKQIYKELQLDKFWKNVASQYDIEYDLNGIFQLLVYMRIIFPASKKATFDERNRLYESFGDFELEDVYRALDIISAHDAELQKWLYDHSCTSYKRDMSISYFDCTNYYWDISKPDMDELDDDGNVLEMKYRKMGPEKNNRKDPIVELGLLMDSSGIPLAYDLFPGNESEKIHMLPIINRARSEYGFSRTICVADRGLNTSDNIYYLNGNNKGNQNNRDGYVYGQSVRGADAEFKAWVLNQDDYINTAIDNTNASDNTTDKGIFRHKSRIYPKKLTVHVETKDGVRTKVITVDQKQMVYYSAKYAKRMAETRNRQIARAQDLIAHPKKYDKVAAKGASGYVMNLSFTKDGEVIDKNLVLDVEKIQEEAKYDGYYSIVTSELNLSDEEIREIYRGLIHIEDTFKLTKSELDTRPIFVRTNEHIEGHFSTCYTALVLIRLLEQKLGNQYPVGRILQALREYNCLNVDQNLFIMPYTNEILYEIGKIFGVDLTEKYKTASDLRRLLKY